jgi:hypothetical protein
MSKKIKTEVEDNNIIEKYGDYAIWVSVFVFWFYVLITYVYNLTSEPTDSVIYSNFGTIGDFIGGILNPILALIGLFALLTTIRLQIKEFKLTREEFIRQAEALEMQQVDNKFFQMLDELNNLINRLEHSGAQGIKIFDELVTSSESYFYDIEKFQTKFNQFNYDFDSTYKYYFLNLYQIINYIDQNVKYKDDDPKEKKDRIKKLAKEYINIIRAQQTRSQLKLLFFNCIGISSFSTTRYKELVEKYAFFEHVRYSDLLTKYDKEKDEKHNNYEDLEARYVFYEADYYENNNRLIDSLLVKYEENAFGSNEYLKEIWNNRNKLLGDKK